ncbi:MAG: BamA/TamA family outer membrane protein [Myxococcota bacterium]|nr:BamA/TamA family outer membrane protein [Myxococcota bacterium]MDW8362575.1 POTRA domain-containing protein [Myxococcales bacterium]
MEARIRLKRSDAIRFVGPTHIAVRATTQRTDLAVRAAGRLRAWRARRRGARRPGIAGLVIAISVAVVAPAAAQIPPTLAGRPIVEIHLEGPGAPGASVRDLGIPIGVGLERSVLRGAMRRLLATGRWDDVRMDVEAIDGGLRLRVRLEPRVRIVRIDWVGNERFDDEELDRLARATVGDAPRAADVESLQRALVDAYVRAGHPRVRVHAELRATQDAAEQVLFVRIEEGAPTRIGAIEWVGLDPRARDVVEGVLDVGVGDVLDVGRVREAFEAAGRALRAQGWLEANLGEWRVREEASVAVLRVEARLGPRYEVRIAGSEPLSRSRVHDELALQEAPWSIGAERAVAARVVDLYRRMGFDAARCHVRVVRGPRPDYAILDVRITPGPHRPVLDVAFPGARRLDVETLREAVWGVLAEELPGSTALHPVDSAVVDGLFGGTPRRAASSPAIVDPRRTWYPPAYERVVEHLTEMYRAEGFLSASVGPARAEPVARRGLVVVIPVTEGPRTSLWSIDVRGNRAVSAHELLGASGLRSGAPFGHLALEQARRRMLEVYRERGFLYATVTPQVWVSSDGTRAAVRFEVQERWPVTVGPIRLEGLSRTDERIVRDRIELVPGEVYRPELVRRTRQRLSELGVFRAVAIGPEDPDVPARLKPVVVELAERSAQYLDVAAGVSSGEGLRGGFEYGHRNLFGWAVGLTLHVRMSYPLLFTDTEVARAYEQLPLEDRLERSVGVGLGVPHMPLRDVRLGLDLVHGRDNERDFGLDENRATLSIQWRPMRRLTLTASEELENTTVQLFDAAAIDEYLVRRAEDPETSPAELRRLRELLRVPDGTSTLLGTRVTVGWDGRDSPFTPTRGVAFNVGAEWARTLAGIVDEGSGEPFRSHFLRLMLSTSGYLPLADAWVLAGQLRVGRIVPLVERSETYPNRAFFLGGVDTMRGYLQDALVPEDIAEQVVRSRREHERCVAAGGSACPRPLDARRVVRAADAMLLVRGEVRFPIAGNLHGGLFADVGNLWADASRLDPFDLRLNAGLGLRLMTPIGPLAFDYGFVVTPRTELDEPPGTLHFSMGLF